MATIGEPPAAAFERLAAFLTGRSLTGAVASLEYALVGCDGEQVAAEVRAAGFQPALLEDALSVRRDLGRLNDLIHATAIGLALPFILEPDERLTNRPSLAAGNDQTRPFDVETDRRVAEFKLAVWSGSGTDPMRKRAVFHDLVHLAADSSGRRAVLYVLGDRPLACLRFLRRPSAGPSIEDLPRHGGCLKTGSEALT